MENVKKRRMANVTATVEMIVAVDENGHEYDNAEFLADLGNAIVSSRWVNVTGTRIAYLRDELEN